MVTELFTPKFRFPIFIGDNNSSHRTRAWKSMLSLYASSFCHFPLLLLLSHQQQRTVDYVDRKKVSPREPYINRHPRPRSCDPASVPLRSLAWMCCVSYSDPSPLLPAEEKSKEEEQRCSASMEVDAEASYSYGFHPPGRHQPYASPPPPPPEDGELWEYFPCPFCYIEVEMPFICSHLQEEHCFDTRNAVCPICAENLGKDMSTHFRFQHSHLLKRRKPSRPSSSPPAYEVNPYMMSSRPCQDPEPDPLLSQFICGNSADQTEPGLRDGAIQQRHRPSSAHPADAQRPVPAGAGGEAEEDRVP